MKPFLPVTGILLVGLSTSIVAADLELEAPGIAVPILVSLPDNHDPAKSWPAVFSYHGFNGRPNTRSTRAHTGARDWIVVGMSYTQPGKYHLEPEDIAAELKAFRHIRDELARTQGLDLKRVYASGYSKGGWMTDTLLQAEPGFAGGAILMGGHIPSPLSKPPPISKDTEVFIGIGRWDPNYIPSLKALVHYRGLGLTTSFEAWPELGHDFPSEGSPGLREWFTLQNGGKPDDAALEKEVGEILKLPPAEAWIALADFKERPFCNIEASEWPDKISAAQKDLEKDPQVAREAQIRSSHRQLLGREVKMRTLEDLRRIDAGYMKLSAISEGSPQAKDIVHDHRRILAVLKQANATEVPRPKPSPITPAPPKDDRNIPGNPLVR
ncbi:alpha/beta hydrolase [Haloferula sp.]|uniref:alpha/beta hydrolase n=1 Tax=Haloferula sp. TaxID=2497595 RepID=UPI003C707D04